MFVATVSLSAVALSAVGIMHLLLPTFNRGNTFHADGIPAPSTPSDTLSPPPPASAPAPSEQDQEAFLELVKRRVNIKTTLDTTFWRPYVRSVSKDVAATNQTQLIFVAGAEGTGHHFVTAVMMRLSQLMPMTLVEEQVFQALWWNTKAHDPAKFWSAVEAFQQWVQVARSKRKHPAFCARTCLRGPGLKHCSWISGMQQQMEGTLLAGKGHNGTFQPIGQMFSYPFSRSWNETEDGTHYPEIKDLKYLCELAGLRLRVIVLWREPVDAIMSMNNRGLPKIWRRFGRTFKLHKQVGLFLSQLDEMHSQLSQLDTESYRILNYTDLLINWQAYTHSLADFLNIPEAEITRAFTLSMKAKPKKRKSEAEVPPLDNSVPLQWSDEVRRSFIDQRLKEATNSPDPPRCCKTWTEALKRTAVVRLPQKLPPSRPEKHWFSAWAETAAPPLRVENLSFTHVINPFHPSNDEEHDRAQRTSMLSIAHAQALALAQGIFVDVVCAMFESDVRKVDPEKYGFSVAILNVSTLTTLPQFHHPVKLPFLNQILYAGYLHGKGKYLVYSNIDIGLQPPFYIKISRQLQVMPDVPLSLIREEFEHVPRTFSVEDATARRGGGLGHPGHDCWAFPRSWVPEMLIGFTMVGVSMVATDLMQALYARSHCRMTLLSDRLTFHFVEGDSVVKHPGNQRARNDKIFTGLYTAWNCAQFARNRRDVMAVHPEYAQCWFSQQAEWNVYSYQCAATIEHLPHEFKLLWHGNASREMVPARANCNLPSICQRCRGEHGGLRPVASLSDALPCGFCRCNTDLEHPPYVTPPKLDAPSFQNDSQPPPEQTAPDAEHPNAE